MHGGFECVVVCRPEVAFDFLADLRNEVQWNPRAVRVEKLADAGIGLGNRFRGIYQAVGWVDTELVEYDRPHRLSFRREGRRLVAEGTFVLRAGTPGTTITLTEVVHPRGRARLMGAGHGPGAGRRLKAALDRLAFS